MPGVAVSHDVDIGSEAHRQAVEAAIHGTVKIPQDHVDVMESLRDSLGFERSVRQQAMGWKHKGGWKDVEANAVVTEGVWGVGIEGGIGPELRSALEPTRRDPKRRFGVRYCLHLLTLCKLSSSRAISSIYPPHSVALELFFTL